MSDIFLSYAREDRARVLVLVERLEARGWSVWGLEALPSGAVWQQEVEAAITDARCVIVVWSERSVRSEWVLTEARTGLERGVLLPILFGDVRIPRGFEHIQHSRLTGQAGSWAEAEIEQVLAAVGALLGRSPPSVDSDPAAASDESSTDTADGAAGGTPGTKPTSTRLRRIARAVSALAVVALAVLGVNALRDSVREVTVRLHFGPAVKLALTPAGTEPDDGSLRAATLADAAISGRLRDLVAAGLHRLDEFALLIQDAESGDTLAVVDAFRGDALLMGADSAGTAAARDGAQPAASSLAALLRAGRLSGDATRYERDANDSVRVAERTVTTRSRLFRDSPIQLNLTRIDWGGGELVGQALLQPAGASCEEATGGGGLLGRGRLYDCFLGLADLTNIGADAAARPTPPPLAGDDNPPILIEGGTFMMGSEGGSTNERPVHQVTVSSFWIQQHEVTNEEYARFDPSHTFPVDQERHPVVNVTWQQAMDYAASRGGSLPTEAQWEYAARGAAGRTYPWGDELPTCALAQYAICNPPGTAEVMSHAAGATAEGVHDLAGNALEWVRDWFVEYDSASAADPQGLSGGPLRVLRGGSFGAQAINLRSADRFVVNPADPALDLTGLGFRVAWALAGGQE